MLMCSESAMKKANGVINCEMDVNPKFVCTMIDAPTTCGALVWSSWDIES